MTFSPKAIGKRIRAIREEKKLNQTEFGSLIGVSNTTVSNYEMGDSYPFLEVLIKIARIGGKSFDWLISGISPKAARTELTDQELRILQAVRSLDEELLDMIHSIAELSIRRNVSD